MAQQGTGLTVHSKVSPIMGMVEVDSEEERVIRIADVVNLRIDPSQNTLYQIARLGYS
jgi:hypothetical protein